jgi:hypothetical protein
MLFSQRTADFSVAVLTQAGDYVRISGGAASNHCACPKKVQFFPCLFAFYSPRMWISCQLSAISSQLCE